MNLTIEPNRRPDLDAIRQLRALDVGLALGLLDGPDRSNRYRFSNYEGSFWLQFFDDGKWTGHKFNGLGGDSIALLRAYDAGPAYNFEPSRGDYGRALQWLARQYGLWKDIEPQRQLAKQLVTQSHQTAWQFLDSVVDAVEMARYPQPAWQQVQTLCGALGVDAETITICPYPSAETGSICWQPAVPWQGMRVSRKANDLYGGWTKARAQQYISHQNALSVFVIDLDGSTEHQRKPSVVLTDRLIRELAKRGLPVAAHVWSSFDDNEPERAKSHLYFKAQKRARNEQEYAQWWSLIAQTIDRIVKSWRLNDTVEALTFKPDPSTSTLSALVRLPGFHKFGSPWAAVIESTSKQTVDFETLWETQPIEFQSGSRRYIFQRGSCWMIEHEHEQPKHTLVCESIWPLNIYQDDSERFGARVRFEDLIGNTKYLNIGAESWTCRSARQDALGKLASAGAMNIHPQFLQALEAWVNHCKPSVVYLTQLPGWHGDSYLNGTTCFGHSPIVGDDSAPSIRPRCVRAGSFEGWQEGARELLKTHGLLTGLAQSLAGPLLNVLNRPGFNIHLWGSSSCGKSTVAWAASSLWYARPRDFNKTARFIDQDAVAANGACLILDELGQANFKPDELANFIYNITAGMQRGRLFRDGRAQHRHQWLCTMLTNGEFSIASALGPMVKGGHVVRFIDLAVEPGECSTSAQHAMDVGRWARENHGHAGDAWINHIIQMDANTLCERHTHLAQQLRQNWQPNEESGRILEHLAVTILALQWAMEVGMVYWIDPTSLSLWSDWLVQRVLSNTHQSPETRTWALIQETLERNRYLFPFEADDQRDALWGILAQDGNTFFTTRTLLAQHGGPCHQNHIGVERFLQWAIQQGFTDGEARNVRRGRLRRRWLEFRVDQHVQSNKN